MGNCVGGFKRRTRNIVWPKNKAPKTLVIAFLGLDGAGKTTVVKALQGEGAESVHPTMGFSRGEFTVNKCKIIAYDLGGAERIRDIWKIYYAEIYAIVYVVDSAASSRMEENKQVVNKLREHPDLMYKPILFLLNKKDLPEAIDEMAFSEMFALHTMACDNRTDIRVEGICAVKGHGKEIDPMIVEGVGWLIERVLARYDQLNKEIEAALKVLKEKQAHERLQRQHRLANLANRQHTPPEAEMEEIPTTSEIIIQPNGILPSNKEIAVVEHHEPPPISTKILRSNKIVPQASVEEVVRPRNSITDYKVFEMEDIVKTKKSPLRRKSFDSRILFQPARRPQLLMSHDNGAPNSDIEMVELTQTPNHINKKEASNLEESWST